ncbi:MAG TPA: alanine dehydrogenase [Burkholderiales bacterium]|nr:alanine dehydrogenase [Burkholderiales bacterium]
MRVGIPREIKDGEFRVALTPAGVGSLECDVIVERGAGEGVGFSDQDYTDRGAQLGDPWECDLVVKVKELQEPEYRRPRRGQTIFGFQHLAPDPALLGAALASGATFVAFETVGQADGSLPILAPMSAIAGRLAVQAGAWCLQKQNGGSGVLLPGLDGVPAGKVVILGAGNVGSNALAVAHGMGAEVSVFAKTEKRFPGLRERFPGVKLKTGKPIVADGDLVIGGVLTPGQMSPKLVSRDMLRRMRRGSALVDVGIDQGGIAETSRPTSHSDPIYIEEGVVHYCVPNLPSACARTASLALERAVLPFIKLLVNEKISPELRTGIQVRAGKVTHEQLARDTSRSYSPL